MVSIMITFEAFPFSSISAMVEKQVPDLQPIGGQEFADSTRKF